MAESANSSGVKLSDIFKEIWDIHNFLETTDDPTNSKLVQDKVREGAQKAEEAVKMVNMLQVFSTNESVEEVATNELKYMLLPALLGYFTDKSIKEKRLPLLKKSEKFYKDFLRLCRSYNVASVDILGEDDEEEVEGAEGGGGAGPVAVYSASSSLAAMGQYRQKKIEHFRQKKEYERKIKELQDAVEKDSVDDEVKRDYYMTLLKMWITKSSDELVSIHGEIPIVEHMMKAKHPFGDDETAAPAPPPDSTQRKFRPFILTKTALQKKVFGAGYPSLPTMTIEEFFQEKVEMGQMQPQSMGAGNSLLERAQDPERDKAALESEAAENERLAEVEDPDALQRQRGWDDWKDDHRRGWGNRKNMG